MKRGRTLNEDTKTRTASGAETVRFTRPSAAEEEKRVLDMLRRAQQPLRAEAVAYRCDLTVARARTILWDLAQAGRAKERENRYTYQATEQDGEDPDAL